MYLLLLLFFLCLPDLLVAVVFLPLLCSVDVAVELLLFVVMLAVAAVVLLAFGEVVAALLLPFLR
jgi:hypothetical protein